MNKASIIGLDLAKRSFQAHGMVTRRDDTFSLRGFEANLDRVFHSFGRLMLRTLSEGMLSVAANRLRSVAARLHFPKRRARAWAAEEWFMRSSWHVNV